MVYLLSFLIGIPSPVFLFLNAEVWTVTAVLTSDAKPLLVGTCVGLGQIVGYLIVFFRGPWLLDRIPRLRERMAKVDIGRYEALGYVGIVTGSLLQFPPAIALTFLRVPLRFRFVIWFPVVVFSRLARFIIIASLPDVFADFFHVHSS